MRRRSAPGHLWIFNHHAATPDQSTGTRHFDIARELVSAGWRVTIFAAGFSHLSGREEKLRRHELVRTERLEGVDFVWLRTFPYRGNGVARILNMVSYFLLALAAQARFSRPTHVIGSTVHPLAALAGLVSAKLHRARYFFEIRDLWPQTLIDLGAITEDGLPARALRALERYLVEHARAVITLLPGTADYLRLRGFSAKRVVVIPNGVRLEYLGGDAPIDRPTVDAVRSVQASGALVVLYAGAHGIANGLDSVLSAARCLKDGRHDDIRIFLIGDGPEKHRLVARARAERIDNVIFGPAIAKRTIPSVLAAVDACLLHIGRSPVHRFGVSFNKLYDYMASGKPIIFACDVPDDPVRLSGAGWTVPDDDPGSLAAAIVEMRDTPANERANIGVRGRQYVEKHHSMATLARELEAVLGS